jgi:hypothetical protein
MILFQLQELYNVEWDGNVIMKAEFAKFLVVNFSYLFEGTGGWSVTCQGSDRVSPKNISGALPLHQPARSDAVFCIN